MGLAARALRVRATLEAASLFILKLIAQTLDVPVGPLAQEQETDSGRRTNLPFHDAYIQSKFKNFN